MRCPNCSVDDDRVIDSRSIDAGGAILIPENLLDPATLTQQITSVLTQERGAVRMGAAALSAGRPDAGERLAGLVEALAAKETA